MRVRLGEAPLPKRLRRGAAGGEAPSPRDRAAAKACSILLDYPGPEVRALSRLVAEALGAMEAPSAAMLAKFLSWYGGTGDIAAQAHYVQTFDLRRKASLHLSYYTDGETRRRGATLVEFAQAFRQAGVQAAGNELGDHLPLLCELASEHPSGFALLRENRAGIEMLAEAVCDSPYRWVVATVLGLSGPSASPGPKRLSAWRPPAEQVGL